jgi:hypothetical protein
MSNNLRHYKNKKIMQIKCSMCENNMNEDSMFIPSECLMKYGVISHRICQDCWWNDKTGFAQESSCHKCPGCIKNIPLTEYKRQIPIFIDLTEE